MVFKSILPDVEIPEVTFHDLVLKNCNLYGDQKALICGETGRCYTYRQLPVLTRAVASGLVKLGVKKGTVVAILLPNVIEYALCFLGTLAAGGITTTINPAYTPNELSKQLCDSGAYAVITLKGLEDTVNKALKQAPSNVKVKILLGEEAEGFVPFTQLLEDDGTAYPNLTFDVKNDVAAIPYSSGTTGLPKGVMLTHYNLVANFHMINAPQLHFPELYRFSATNNDATLLIIPAFHAYGLFTILMQGIWVGHSIVHLSRFQPETFLNAVHQNKITILLLVPPLVIFLAKHPMVKNYDFSYVKVVGSSAAPLSSDVIDEFKKRVPVDRILQGYGMTETSPTLTNPLPETYIPGSSGIIIPSTSLRIVDITTGKDLGYNERGEIWAKGPQVMKGYLNNSKATEETIDKDGWLHTGDVGYIDENNHIFIVDRIKELIKYKGFQVAPAEMEALLLTHADISDAAVIGIADSKAGELPRAYIVVKDGHTVTEEEIHAFLKENAAPYKQMRGGIQFVKSIPKTPSGKIMRNELRAKFTNSNM